MTLEVKLKKLKLKNPIILASGTFDHSITKHINPNDLGALVTKTITLEPRKGNPLPHIIKTPFGYLNSVGLKNPGIKKFLKEELPFWQKFNTIIIPSIGGKTIKEYLTLASALNKTNIQAIEVNVSCPNVENGLIFGTNEKSVKKLIQAIRKKINKSLVIKLSPNVTDIVSIAKATLEAKADIISLSNTFLGMSIDNQKRKAIFYRKFGGYSGPAIKPMTLKIVWEVYKKLRCPIIGSGGITNFSDVLDYIMVGANAVAIGSASYNDPKISIKIIKNFESYLKKQKIKDLNQIRGII